MLHYKNTNELVMFHVFGVHLLWMYVMIFIIIGTQKFSFLLEVFSQFNESEHVFSIVVSNQKHVFLSRRCKDDLKHVPLTSEYAQYLTTVDTFKRGVSTYLRLFTYLYQVGSSNQSNVLRTAVFVKLLL